jgi:hypothetical protein
MITTKSIADSVKKTLPRGSHYALAKVLGISDATVAAWYKKGTVMDDETALKCANLAGLDQCEVLIALMIERSKNPETREAWKGCYYQTIQQPDPAKWPKKTPDTGSTGKASGQYSAL